QRESDGKVFRVRDVVIKRTYWNDVMQAWGDSCSFSVEELPRVRLVADQAYAFCLEARERERETEKKQNRTGS
ncbi:MAG: hypothetical protein JXM70_18895, partial [Pirellulales bacterium]|nr:hypothetical protein [Pirellulales bacterium]